MRVRTYKVRVVHTITYDVEVEAPTRLAAEEVAKGKSSELDETPDDAKTKITVQAFQQIGEPWVEGWCGNEPTNSYNGRPDCYMDSDDLLVFNRAFGNVFSQREVDALIYRAGVILGRVHSHWNGVGHQSLSIRMVQPFKALNEAQIRALMMPLGES